MRKQQSVLIILLCCSVLLSSCSTCPTQFQSGERTSVPYGCLEGRHREVDCMYIYHELSDIFLSVKQRFSGDSDLNLYGKREYWESPDELQDSGKIVGDCDAFALACRKICRERGIKSRLVHCITDKGMQHLVLESNGYVLDNLQNRVIRNSDLNYTWIRMSGYNSGDPWTCVKERSNDLG